MTALSFFVAPPDVTPLDRVVTTASLRYEDVAQDGRLRLLGMPHALGVLWRQLMSAHPIAALGRDGVLAILTHLVAEGGEGPLSIGERLTVDGRFRLGHTLAPSGDVERIILDMWVLLDAPRARTHGAPPSRSGELQRVGRVFARHVFSRPFAAPEERRVRALRHPDLPEVPGPPLEWVPPARIAELPAGGAPLDTEPAPDPAGAIFGLDHTDSNRHVNSLVYPRLFEEATLRRLAAHEQPIDRLDRSLAVGFRKPCFAGERYDIVLQSYTLSSLDAVASARAGDGPEARARAGAVGAFVPLRGGRGTVGGHSPSGVETSRPPHVFARIELD